MTVRSFPANKLHLIPKSGNYPLGFLAGNAFCGIKKNNPDIAIVISPKHQCNVAAVFTTNKFCAAPVTISKEILRSHGGTNIYGCVVNSGNANACTGEAGLAAAKKMSAHFGQSPVVVMSTGVIGQTLPVDKVLTGLTSASQSAGNSHNDWMRAAEGIMTTDTFPKLISREFKTQSGTYRMAGWSKGAGMIHPNMATMLSSIFTDCKVSPSVLEKAVKYAADRSFNAISIDGDTSTNDTFAVFANGAASIPQIQEGSLEEQEFTKNLTEFAVDLAKLIVRDGEGATKFVQVKVSGAKTFESAKQVASTIATSPLVKTAIYGKDANWGRIVCAVGYSGEDIVPSKVNLHFASLAKPELNLHLFKYGAPFNIDENIAKMILENEDILVHVDLGLGSAEFSIYTCDMSHEYISVNANYRS